MYCSWIVPHSVLTLKNKSIVNGTVLFGLSFKTVKEQIILPAKKRRGGEADESKLEFGCSPVEVTGQAKMS